MKDGMKDKWFIKRDRNGKPYLAISEIEAQHLNTMGQTDALMVTIDENDELDFGIFMNVFKLFSDGEADD